MLNKKDYLIILILTIIFSGLICYKLGYHTINQYIWQPTKDNQQIKINFQQPTIVSKIYFQNSLIDGKYHFEYLNPVTNQTVYLDTNMDRFHNNFQWNKVIINNLQPINQITLKVDKLNIQLIQLALFDQQGNYLTNYTLDSSDNQDVSKLISPTPPKDIDNNYMSSTIFDEIYYTASAYQYIHGIPPYVNVHPPLGMLLIAIGIIIFGLSPFGWRIICCSSSILLLPVIYVFSKKMFNSTRVATLSTLLIFFELMHFTIGRLAFLDSIVTLFIVIEYYYLFKYIEHRHSLQPLNKKAYKYLLLCGIFFGFGLSTKLNAGFSAPLILIVIIYYEFITNTQTIKQSIIMLAKLGLIFIVIPLTIYTLSYIPYANSMHSTDIINFTINKFIEMKHYQIDGLTNATHPYASKWWSWPLLLKPMSIYYWMDNTTNLSSSIAFIGNPAIFWPMIPLVIYLIYQYMKTCDYKAGFILLSICSQYIPYIIITRISFIYYFYPTVPFLILGYTYLIDKLLKSADNRLHYIAYAFVIINGLFFILFYPAISGMVVPRSYIVNNLLLLHGWNF